jgi:tight adherence protein C
MTLVVIAVVCLAAALYLVAELVTVPARERRASVRRAVAWGRAVPVETPKLPGVRERVLTPLAQALARLVLRLSPTTTVESVDRKLLSAGLNRRLSAYTFLAVKAALALAGLVAGIALAASGSVARGLIFAIAFAGVGFLVPDAVLGRKLRRRTERIQARLPDALDLLAVSVEAGLGFDGALAKLSEHLEGPVAEEFSLTLAEMRVGETRQQALQNLAERTNAPEISALTRAILQSDQLGIPLAKILRHQATDTRKQRQAVAEEKANKAPIKMIFPTALFIFPALFLVLLGPAFIKVSELF